jgi:hypothetical protein
VTYINIPSSNIFISQFNEVTAIGQTIFVSPIIGQTIFVSPIFDEKIICYDPPEISSLKASKDGGCIIANTKHDIWYVGIMLAELIYNFQCLDLITLFGLATSADLLTLKPKPNESSNDQSIRLKKIKSFKNTILKLTSDPDFNIILLFRLMHDQEHLANATEYLKTRVTNPNDLPKVLFHLNIVIASMLSSKPEVRPSAIQCIKILSELHITLSKGEIAKFFDIGIDDRILQEARKESFDLDPSLEPLFLFWIRTSSGKVSQVPFVEKIFQEENSDTFVERIKIAIENQGTKILLLSLPCLNDIFHKVKCCLAYGLKPDKRQFSIQISELIFLFNKIAVDSNYARRINFYNFIATCRVGIVRYCLLTQITETPDFRVLLLKTPKKYLIDIVDEIIKSMSFADDFLNEQDIIDLLIKMIKTEKLSIEKIKIIASRLFLKANFIMSSSLFHDLLDFMYKIEKEVLSKILNDIAETIFSRTPFEETIAKDFFKLTVYLRNHIATNYNTSENLNSQLNSVCISISKIKKRLIELGVSDNSDNVVLPALAQIIEANDLASQQDDLVDTSSAEIPVITSADLSRSHEGDESELKSDGEVDSSIEDHEGDEPRETIDSVVDTLGSKLGNGLADTPIDLVLPVITVITDVNLPIEDHEGYEPRETLGSTVDTLDAPIKGSYERTVGLESQHDRKADPHSPSIDLSKEYETSQSKKVSKKSRFLFSCLTAIPFFVSISILIYFLVIEKIKNLNSVKFILPTLIASLSVILFILIQMLCQNNTPRYQVYKTLKTR